MCIIEDKVLKTILILNKPSICDIEKETKLARQTVKNTTSKLVKDGKLTRKIRLDDARRTYYQIIEEI